MSSQQLQLPVLGLYTSGLINSQSLVDECPCCPTLLLGNYWLLMDVWSRGVIFFSSITTGEPTSLHWIVLYSPDHDKTSVMLSGSQNKTKIMWERYFVQTRRMKWKLSECLSHTRVKLPKSKLDSVTCMKTWKMNTFLKGKNEDFFFAPLKHCSSKGSKHRTDNLKKQSKRHPMTLSFILELRACWCFWRLMAH